MTDRTPETQATIAELVARRVRALRESEPPAGNLTRPLMHTVPMMIAGTMTLALGADVLSASQARAAEPEQPVSAPQPVSAAPQVTVLAPQASSTAAADEATVVVAAAVPNSVTVRSGDTVSGIAAKYGLSTSAVLKLNGLKATSLIFPGQVLQLKAKTSTSTSTPKPSTPSTGSTNSSSTSKTTYTVKSGDTVSGIAAKHKVSTQSVLDANKLKATSIIYPGQKLVIPAAKTASTGGSSSSTGGSNGSGSNGGGSNSGTPATDTGAGSSSGSNSGGSSDPVLVKCESVRYTINAGDTVSKIASKFGVTTQSILNANGLTWTSIIYAGATLTIPNPTQLTDGCVVTASLTTEMKRNAKVIVDVGRAAGVSDYGLIIALATAAQESGLRNIAYGDRDSLGLFQQRPSSGWGTAAQIMDPVHASKAFFGGAGNPNKGKTIGLLDISGWQNMTVTQAAQAVQRSATPNAYAKWEASARQWLAELR